MGTEHQATSSAMTTLANILTERGAYDEAERLFRESARLKEESDAPDHPHLADAYMGHARLLMKREDFAGAERLLQRALAVLRRHFADEHPGVRTAFRAYAELYEVWEKPDEAARYRALAAGTPEAGRR